MSQWDRTATASGRGFLGPLRYDDSCNDSTGFCNDSEDCNDGDYR